ncbi:DUF2273 domain-containing protein [Galactobacter valiniphilus]|uniref:DUF2273 domain-containing protein n=1 Tax=Galactobacter valiniphilus TaxID=2676122 RepID=UPI001314F84D|nr:DUF2273 domain-containing protein [Galactobacter valiniphilus]
MKLMHWGIVAGLVIGLVLAFGSFTQLIIVLFFTLLGAVTGWVLQNKADLSAFIADRRR